MTVVIPDNYVEVSFETFQAAKDYVYEWSRTAFVNATAYYNDRIGVFAYNHDDGRFLLEPRLAEAVRRAR